jgi:predicted acyl esterase
VPLSGRVLKPRVDSFDYVKREVMVPMRDGVRVDARRRGE